MRARSGPRREAWDAGPRRAINNSSRILRVVLATCVTDITHNSLPKGGAGVNQFRAGKKLNSGALPLSHIRCPFATSMARQYPKTDIAEVEVAWPLVAQRGHPALIEGPPPHRKEPGAWCPIKPVAPVSTRSVQRLGMCVQPIVMVVGMIDGTRDEIVRP
jgi:hypothetical protein